MKNDSNHYNNTFLKNSVQSRVDSLTFQKKQSYSLYLLRENIALHQTLWHENCNFNLLWTFTEEVVSAEVNWETNPKQENNAR